MILWTLNLSPSASNHVSPRPSLLLFLSYTNLSIKVITVVNEFTICLKYKSLLCFLQHGHVSIWDSISFYYLINISECPLEFRPSGRCWGDRKGSEVPAHIQVRGTDIYTLTITISCSNFYFKRSTQECAGKQKKSNCPDQGSSGVLKS